MRPQKLRSDLPIAQRGGEFVPRVRRKGQEISVVVVPTPRRNGRFVARLGEGGQVLGKSSTKPFFDAARRLMDLGFDPSATLVMLYSGSDTVCLHASIGTAAAPTVEDTQYGPRFRPWKPICTQAVSRKIASNSVLATTLAAEAISSKQQGFL